MSRFLSRLASRHAPAGLYAARMNNHRLFCSKEGNNSEETVEDDKQSAEEITLQSTEILEGLGQNIVGSLRRPKAKDKSKEKDRRIPIPWQTSIRYMESQAYRTAYGNYLVWQLFRRNFGGQFYIAPANTRISCVGDDGFIKYGQACPICRDEYLVLHHKNVKLLKQFISPHTGQVLPPRKTNLCQVKHEELLIALYKAKDYGTLPFHMPFRYYDYKDYYGKDELKNLVLEEGFDASQDPVLEKALQDPDFGEHHDYAIENFP